MMKLNRRTIVFICTIVVGVFFLLFYNPIFNRAKYLEQTGRVHGTFYKIVYEAPKGDPVTGELDSLFHAFDLSLSTFNDSSVISRINRNDSDVEVDAYFRSVFETANQVSENTNGAFDMTVAPLVNAWGFGFKKKEDVTPELIDSLMKHVGYKKVRLDGNRILKADSLIMLDASAIAKGYSCDVVAAYLESKGVKNYMVDIGGEVVTKGFNALGLEWTVGIEKPLEDSTMMNVELQSIIQLKDLAVATSGNYRQYYHKDGKKFSHTINPHTGYPVEHNLLSATVVASNCKTADAYATAFMVLGLEHSIMIANAIPDLEAYFIYSDSLGNFAVEYTAGFEKFLKLKDVTSAETEE